MTHPAIALAEFPRLFCLAAALILNELPPANELSGGAARRRELVTRIAVSDTLTLKLRQGSTDEITLRANLRYWRELAEETQAMMTLYTP